MMNSTIVNKYISYNSELLRKQITENSKKIDMYLMDLKELEKKICGKDIVKAAA